jgi:hypothetical protein
VADIRGATTYITGGSLDKSVAPSAAAVGTLSVGLEFHNFQSRAGHSRRFQTVAEGGSGNLLAQDRPCFPVGMFARVWRAPMPKARLPE